MRIVCLAHYSFEYNFAGGEQHLHNILKHLAKEHDVTVLITSTPGKPRSSLDGIKYVYLNTPLRFYNLTSLKPEIIISHFNNTMNSIRYGRMLRTPVVTVVHNDRAETLRMANFLTNRDLVLANSEWIAKKINTRAGKIVVRPSIDVVRTVTDTKDGKYITLVNITPPKGSETFYKLARELPDKQFLAVGGGYWKNTQVIENLPNVIFMENQPDMKKIYAISRIVLVPSDYETYGLVAREAIANGIPVIAHETEGLRENLGNAGIFLDRNDIKAWKEIILLLDKVKYYQEWQNKSLERFKEEENRQAELDYLSERIKNLR